MKNELQQLKDRISSLENENGKLKRAVQFEQSRSRIYRDIEGEAVIVTNEDELVTTMNPVAQRLTGWDESCAIGQPLHSIFSIVDSTGGVGEEQGAVRSPIINPNSLLPYEEILVSRSGKKSQILNFSLPIRDLGGNSIGKVHIFRDISRLQRFEQENLRIAKLESIGVLAGGIAHDFNNILTVAMGNLSLARRRSHNVQGLDERLFETEKAMGRARGLTNQLLTFSKGGAPIKAIASASQLIEDSAAFMLRGSKAKCDLALSNDLWPVEVDEVQMGQVIQNLVINADQSMPDGGMIRISARNMMIESKDGLPLKPGKFVRVSITDSGVGIPEKNLSRIFDPYFTTKKDGTGLGLATTYSVLRRHEGYITVESVLNVGTTFHMFLPAKEAKITVDYGGDNGDVIGGGSVLLMDDDEVVLKVAQQMLAELGFEAQVARDGKEAIGLYSKRAQEGDGFDVVIMDLRVPGGMGGKEAVSFIKQIDPAAKVVVSSGYSNDPVMSEFRKYGFCGVVTKPYGVEQLSKMLRFVLGSTPPPSPAPMSSEV